jgi:hypothetical protein
MPGFSISLNGRNVAVVSTQGLNLLSVRIHGDVVGPEFAALDVSGGNYGEGQENVSLTWVAEQALHPGDQVSITLLDAATSSHAGKTIDELYPEDEQPMGPWPSMELAFQQLATMPKVRTGFRFEVVSSQGDAIRSQTAPNDHLFAFSVLWNWLHPERARVSLSSNSLEQVEKREGGHDHTEFMLQCGQSVSLRVNA